MRDGGGGRGEGPRWGDVLLLLLLLLLLPLLLPLGCQRKRLILLVVRDSDRVRKIRAFCLLFVELIQCLKKI